MLKAKITYRETPIEAEADTKRDLEDALEVALNVVARLNIAPLQAYREPETLGAGSTVREPPPQLKAVGGDIPPKQSPDSSKATTRISYKGAKTIGDHVYIALQSLAEQNGIEEGYTNREVIDYLEETGSKIIKASKSKYPIRSVGQAIRFDPRFTRKAERTWLAEWLNESEPLTQLEAEETSEPLDSPDS